MAGLSEELQSQIHRMDKMDERLWEWRRQVESDTRSLRAAFETLSKNKCPFASSRSESICIEVLCTQAVLASVSSACTTNVEAFGFGPC
eukprot:3064861-Amphidinium_carterae.1